MEPARARIVEDFPYPVAVPYALAFDVGQPASLRRWTLCFTEYHHKPLHRRRTKDQPWRIFLAARSKNASRMSRAGHQKPAVEKTMGASYLPSPKNFL